MYILNETERTATPSDIWSTADVKYVKEYLDYEDVVLSEDESWEILKRAVDHVNRMGMALTIEVLEDIICDYIDEKGE